MRFISPFSKTKILFPIYRTSAVSSSGFQMHVVPVLDFFHFRHRLGLTRNPKLPLPKHTHTPSLPCLSLVSVKSLSTIFLSSLD